MNTIYKVLAYPAVQDASNKFPHDCRQIMGEYTEIERAFFRKLELEADVLWTDVELLMSIQPKVVAVGIPIVPTSLLALAASAQSRP